ncbi:MAG: hypothetical protein AAF346_09585 [Pseudomonadota bacterium]
MQERYGMPVWAPTEEEMRALEARVRAERAKAVNGAAAYVAKQVAGKSSAGR